MKTFEVNMTSILCPLFLVLYASLIVRTDCLVVNGCSQLQNYTVSASSGHDTPECASGHSNISCETLEYLFTQVQSCANVTILDHLTLSSTLELSIADLIIAGDKVSPINISCKNSSGLVFKSSQRVHLEGLQFISCSTKCPHENANIYSLVDYAALCVSQGNDIAITNCSFLNGSGTGVILHDVIGSNHLVGTNFTRNGHSHSSRRNSTSGGVIVKRRYIQGEATYIFTTCNFIENKNLVRYGYHNSTGLGGGLHFHFGALRTESFVSLNQSHFSRNVAIEGGGVHVNQCGSNSSLVIVVNQSVFQYNRATYGGGGLWLTHSCPSPSACTLNITNSTFSNNSGSWGGGLAVYTDSYGNITIEASHSHWSKNRAYRAGFAVAMQGYVETDTMELRGNETIFPLVARFSSCFFLTNYKGKSDDVNPIGAIQMKTAKAQFDACSFKNNGDTALHLLFVSYATFAGNTTFSSNSGIRGAAIYVDSKSLIGLRDGVMLRFENNGAVVAGGAIYTESTDIGFTLPQDTCVFESLGTLLGSSKVYTVYFSNNTGSGEDQSIFVGTANGCVNIKFPGGRSILNNRIFTFTPQVSSQFVSWPNNITLDCSPNKTGDFLEVMPGQRFYLVPNVTDIFNNPVYQFGNLVLVQHSSINRVSVFEDLLLVGPKMISMDNYTRNNELYIKGSQSYIGNPHLFVQFIFKRTGSYHDDHRDLQVKLVECKPGFVFRNDSQVCECVNDTNVVCSSGFSYACVRYGYWLGDYSQTNGKALPCSGELCQYEDYNCPKNSAKCLGVPGYCQLNDPDDLCWDGMGGIMCASCRQNYSFTFGALNCVHNSTCTAMNTALITLGVFIYWILVVILVLVILNLDLSMGLGFMYGIVYYFSVLTLFTDVTITDPFLLVIIYTCIAITQLTPRGFGNIEVCFVESWNLNIHHRFFNYATPVFVVGMIVFIIWTSRYCRCPKALSLAENSPIHAICVLILLSYTSLTCTSLEILKPAIVNGESVVYADPKIKYFDPQHLPYAIVAIMFECFVSLPICFLILFAPCLTRKVNMVKLRLKPILDDFQACYRPGYHWFAGFYFLARQVMFLLNVIPVSQLPQENYVFHFVNLILLAIHSTLQPYRLKWLNLLDTLLLFDVLIMSLFATTGTIHRVLSYLLLLPPALYLVTVIVLITCKRVYKCFGPVKAFQAIFRRQRANTEGTTVIPTATSTSVGLDDERHDAADEVKSKAFGGSDFFKDYGEREPLLADSNSEQPSYSSDEGGRRSAHTTSSLRVSALNRFPPPQKKTFTN